MRIAQVAPLFFRVPPERYGGTERIVAYLTDELVNQGHEVTLFASGDSQTKAQLVACSSAALGFQVGWQTHLIHHLLMSERVYKQADRFDVIHAHMELYQAPLARRCQTPTLTTIHTTLLSGNVWRSRLFEEYRELPLASISRFQRDSVPQLNWVGTVHHGLPADLYSFEEHPGSYLAFLGRIAPDKGLPDAIEIAIQAGIPLKIAGNPGILQEDYFTEIETLLAHPLIEYIGEVDDAQKNTFLGQAAALLFPIQWDEPFGIVMIEALACGTPVIAYARGSVPDIISDGVNGFVVSSIEQAVAAVERVHMLSRCQCRASFEQHFTAQGMAQQYLALFTHLIQQAQAKK